MNVLLCCFAGCNPDEFLLNNFCYKECPSHFYAANESTESQAGDSDPLSPPVVEIVPRSGNKPPQVKLVCKMCNMTCLECSGPAAYQCTSCPLGFMVTPNGTCVQYMQKYKPHVLDKRVIGVVVAVCLVAVLVFLVVFMCLQAHSSGYSAVSDSEKGVWHRVGTGEDEDYIKAELLDSEEDSD